MNSSRTMKIWNYTTVVGLLSLWLTGCATPKPDFEVRQAIKDKPLIYLYESAGKEQIPSKIIFQEKHLVTLKPGTYFVHTPDPGEISYRIPKPFDLSNDLTLGLVKDPNISPTTFLAQAGKIYYFKIQGLNLARVDETMALAELVTCHSVSGKSSQ
jgi:hypothetical protein